MPAISPRTIGAGRVNVMEPLALELVAAAVEGHDIEILDMNLDPNLDRALRRFRPSLVGTTGFTVHVYGMHDILRRAKLSDESIVTVVGGPHAAALPRDFAKHYIDAVVLGDGVQTMRDIVASLEEGSSLDHVSGLAIPRDGDVALTPPRKHPMSLEHWPVPNRALTQKYRRHYHFNYLGPIATVATSVGCPYRCSFCAVPSIYPKRLVRSVESVADELATIREPYVFFSDDNIFVDTRRMDELYRLVMERGIKKKYFALSRLETIVKRPEVLARWASIGLVQLFVGIESIKRRDIEMMNKRTTEKTIVEGIEILRTHRVDMMAGFIIQPDYMPEDFDAILRFIEQHGLYLSSFNPLTPIPGSQLYEEMKDSLVLHDYELFDMFHSLLPTKLPPAEFHRQLVRLFYRAMSPIRILRSRPRWDVALGSPRLLLSVMLRSILFLWKLRFAYRARDAHWRDT